MNHVVLTGNSGADGEIRKTPNDFSICNLSLAVSRKVKDEFVSSWFRVVLLGPLADRMSHRIKKGSRLLVSGELQANEWTDKSGNKQSRIEVLAREVQIIEREQKQSIEAEVSQYPSQFDARASMEEMDIPF